MNVDVLIFFEEKNIDRKTKVRWQVTMKTNCAALGLRWIQLKKVKIKLKNFLI